MSHKYEKLDVLQTASVAVCVNGRVLQLIHNTAPSHRRRPTDLCKLRVCHAVDLEGGGGEVTLMHGHWVDVSITCDVIGLEHWLVCLYVQVPVILALVGIWYSNFFGAETYTLLPYDQVSEACVYWIELNWISTKRRCLLAVFTRCPLYMSVLWNLNRTESFVLLLSCISIAVLMCNIDIGVVSICLSIRLSHCSIVSKRLNMSSYFLQHT